MSRLTVLMISVAVAGSNSMAAQMADALDSKASGSFVIIGISSWKSRVMVVASCGFVFDVSAGIAAVAWSASDCPEVTVVVVGFGRFGGRSYGLERLDIPEYMRGPTNIYCGTNTTYASRLVFLVRETNLPSWSTLYRRNAKVRRSTA